MTVSHNHFYYGHGMSIGSETYGGVSKILVTDLSLDGDDNALRIKSNPTRGGVVKDVAYDDVCVRDSKNPILLDTAYSYPGKGKDLFPVYRISPSIICGFPVEGRCSLGALMRCIEWGETRWCRADRWPGQLQDRRGACGCRIRSGTCKFLCGRGRCEGYGKGREGYASFVRRGGLWRSRSSPPSFRAKSRAHWT